MTTSKPTVAHLSRGEYGALFPPSVLTSENLQQLIELRDAAFKAGHLPAPYIQGSKNEFECLNLDIFDVLLFRGKVKGLVVQARSFWRHLRKGHTRTRKQYFLVLKASRRVEVTAIDSATCVKRAKNSLVLGQLVGHHQGKAEVKCRSRSE